MNGIKFIREKSNFTKNALADRIGVTRQTVTQWEKSIRKPDKSHLKWLCDFYGVEEKWFGELSDEELEILKEMKMYRHYDGDKEYFTFIPETDGWSELSIPAGELEEMLDDRYAEVLKKKKDFMQRVEHYLQFEHPGHVSLFDKIIVAERGMDDVNRFLDLMEMMQKVGQDGTFLKIPFRYEILTAMYAMMLASGKCTTDEIKEKHSFDFGTEYGVRVDEEYMNKLMELMSLHWSARRDEEIENVSCHFGRKK